MDWKRLQRVLDRILDKIYEDGKPLTERERIVYLAYYFDAEVHNGGFDQFYFNSQGNHAAETVDALRLIGAVKSAKLLVRANRVFAPRTPSRVRGLRWEQLNKLPKKKRAGWNALDKLYYDCGENVPELLDRYLGGKR
jgi:hypothetical protein